jgi:hypothetical protein
VINNTQASAGTSTEPQAAYAAPPAATAVPESAPPYSRAPGPTRSPEAPAYFRAARPSKARRPWIYAISSVVRQLRRRREWSNYGKFLQRASQKSLWAGLERLRGRIQRTKFLQSPRQ